MSIPTEIFRPTAALSLDQVDVEYTPVAEGQIGRRLTLRKADGSVVVLQDMVFRADMLDRTRRALASQLDYLDPDAVAQRRAEIVSQQGVVEDMISRLPRSAEPNTLG